jgi:hypothetical protein
MRIKISTYIKPISVLIAVLFSLQLNAQRGFKWRNANSDTISIVEVSQLDSIGLMLDTNSLTPLPAITKLGEVTLNMDSAITAIDSVALLTIKPLNGHRIQIYFGDLEGAREIHAKLRKEGGGIRVYLDSNAPNYTVSLGNYRTKWDAQSDFIEILKKYREALIVPSVIELPELN